MKMKKILFFSSVENVGGHEILTIKAAEYLIDINYSITFIINKKNRIMHSKLSCMPKIKIVQTNSKSDRFQIVKNFVNIKEIIILKKLIKKINPDLIIVAQGNIEMSSNILIPAKFTGIPIISYIPLTYRLCDVSIHKNVSKIKDFINIFYFRLPDYFITINEYMKENILKRKVSEENIFVVKNGIDFSKYVVEEKNLARNKLGLKNYKCIYGLVGRVEWHHKGHDLLLDMVKKYRNQFEGCLFVIVGDGSYKLDMELQVIENGIEHMFLFLGNVCDMSLIYSALDVVLIPSRYEGGSGTPLILYEAIYFSKKICASRIDGIKEAIAPEQLFTVSNINEMKNVLLNAQKNDYENNTLLDDVLNEFSIKQFQENFYKAIKEVIRL